MTHLTSAAKSSRPLGRFAKMINLLGFGSLLEHRSKPLQLKEVVLNYRTGEWDGKGPSNSVCVTRQSETAFFGFSAKLIGVGRDGIQVMIDHAVYNAVLNELFTFSAHGQIFTGRLSTMTENIGLVGIRNPKAVTLDIISFVPPGQTNSVPVDEVVNLTTDFPLRQHGELYFELLEIKRNGKLRISIGSFMNMKTYTLSPGCDFSFDLVSASGQSRFTIRASISTADPFDLRPLPRQPVYFKDDEQ